MSYAPMTTVGKNLITIATPATDAVPLLTATGTVTVIENGLTQEVDTGITPTIEFQNGVAIAAV